MESLTEVFRWRATYSVVAKVKLLSESEGAHQSAACLLPLDGLGLDDGLLQVAARRVNGDVKAAVVAQHLLEQALRLRHLCFAGKRF